MTTSGRLSPLPASSIIDIRMRRTACYRVNPVLQETLIFDFSKGQKTTQPGSTIFQLGRQERCWKRTFTSCNRVGTFDWLGFLNNEQKSLPRGATTCQRTVAGITGLGWQRSSGSTNPMRESRKNASQRDRGGCGYLARKRPKIPKKRASGRTEDVLAGST